MIAGRRIVYFCLEIQLFTYIRRKGHDIRIYSTDIRTFWGDISGKRQDISTFMAYIRKTGLMILTWISETSAINENSHLKLKGGC